MTSQPEADYPELDDPSFRAKVAEYLERDEASFNEWLAQDDFEPLIDRAVAKAKDAFTLHASTPEEENPRWTLVVIDLAHRRAKPLVQALAARGFGEIDVRSWTYDVSFRHVMGRRKAATSIQAYWTLEAFALALSKVGFELQLWRE